MRTDRDRAVTGKTMVYDGDCPMCQGISAAFVGLGLFPESERRPYQHYEGETAARIWEAGIRNEIVVLDQESGEIRSGAPGILWMLRRTWVGPLARAFAVRPLSDSLSFLYRLAAYNRRFLSVPRPQGVACACDPDERPAYHVALALLATAVALAIAWAFGRVAAGAVALDPATWSPVRLTLVLAAGWPLLVVASSILPAGRRLAYLVHLAVTGAVGALFLLPAILLGPLLSSAVLAFLLGLGLFFGGVRMLQIQRARLRYLELSGRWLAAWILAVLGGGLAALVALV